jgi:F0F1-type ATP synthase epsilon subunit
VNIDKRRRALERAEDELRDADSGADRRAAERKVKTALRDLRDAEDQLADAGRYR